jgi:DNA invertase Pin-like site-specific DNA recombinase
MSWRNWCMRLTSRKKRSAIVVALFHDFAFDGAIFLASYIIDERADFLGRRNTVLAAAAQHERHMIGERTRHALAAAKARGVKLGNPEQAKINRVKAAARAQALRPHIKRCVKAGRTSSSAIATDLNARGIAAPNGGRLVQSGDVKFASFVP